MRDGYKKTELAEIPVDWEVKKIEDVLQIMGGYAFKSSKFISEKTEDVYQVIRMGNVQMGLLDINKNSVYIKKDILSEKELDYRLKKGDILISLTGTINKTDYGNIAYIDEDGQYLLNQRVACLRLSDLTDSSKYYYYFLQSKWFRNQFFVFGLGGTGNQANVSISDLKGIEIIQPSLIEQKKISDILSTVDTQINQTDKLIKKTKELKKGLMQKLLTKGIGHTEFKKTEVGDIPVEWEVKKFEDIVIEIGQGVNTAVEKTQFVDSGIIMLKAKDINNYRINLDDVSYISKDGYREYNDRYKIEYGDILYTNIGSDLGKASIFNLKIECSYAWNVMRIIPNDYIYNKYLFYLMNSDNFYKNILKRVKGTGMGFVSKNSILSIPVSIPLLTEQKQIANILSSVDKKIEQYEDKKEKLQELKKGLMQQLLTGKMRVKV